jgi:hypothetical protein
MVQKFGSIIQHPELRVEMHRERGWLLVHCLQELFNIPRPVIAFSESKGHGALRRG